MNRLTMEKTASIILFMLIFALAIRAPVSPDTSWHIRSGQYTLENGMIYQDPFSHSLAGEKWVNHSWGAQILMAWIYEGLGDLGMALFTATLATLGMWFLFKICPGDAYLKAFVMIMVLVTSASFWTARPQMFSFLFTCVYLYILYLYKWKGKNYVWTLPILMLIWANLHAGWSIGFILMGAFIVGESLNRLFRATSEPPLQWSQIRLLVFMAIISIFVLVINPNGLNTLLVPFETVGIDFLKEEILEWQSPNFHSPFFWFVLIQIWLILFAVWSSRKGLDWTDFFLVIGTIFMTMYARRNVSVFAVATAPVICLHLAYALRQKGWNIRPQRIVKPTFAYVNLFLIIVISLGVVAYIAQELDPQEVRDLLVQVAPVEAMEYIKENPIPQNLFNSYNWGGYLILDLPEYPVFVDGRTDLYVDFLLDYRAAALGRSVWRKLFDDYDIHSVLIETGSGLADALRQEEDWRIAYEDQLAILFVNP